jgi:hypothetical protein
VEILKLFGLERSCFGMGINHEGEEFRGSIRLIPVVSGKGLRIEFKATSKNNEIFHEESSMLGPGLDGKPCLFVMSNNHPSVVPHLLKREENSKLGHSFVFGFGDVADSNSFREEIVLSVGADNSIEYTYYWGMPGGSFERRSGLKMH